MQCIQLFDPVVDSWGKLPSGVLSGNFYEFGAFSQCFDIKRNDELYKTKYCLGQLALDWKGVPGPKSYESNSYQMDIEPQITPRLAVSQ